MEFCLIYFPNFAGAISLILQRILDACNVMKSHQNGTSFLVNGNAHRKSCIQVFSIARASCNFYPIVCESNDQLSYF